jgi:hypothetical protein
MGSPDDAAYAEVCCKFIICPIIPEEMKIREKRIRPISGMYFIVFGFNWLR